MAGLLHGLENGKDILDVLDLLVGHHDVGLFELAEHVGHVVGHVGRKEAALEHEALLHLDLDAEGLGLLGDDDAVFAHLVDGLGDLLADQGVARGNGGHVGGLLVRLDRDGVFLHGLDRGGGSALDAATDGDRIGARGDAAQADGHELVGEQRSGGGAVAHFVIGLAGNLAHHLGAHLLDGIGEFDILGNGHAVVGDLRRLPITVVLRGDVAALGAERHFHGVGEFMNTCGKAASGIGVESDFLRHEPVLSLHAALGAGPRCVSRAKAFDAPFALRRTATKISTLLLRVLGRKRSVEGRFGNE